jgi:hypothetical protein
MPGVPGRNKIETGFRITWNGVDLSGDLIAGSLNGGGKVLDQVDMHGVSNTIRNYLRGHGSAPITARFHVNDTLSTGSLAALDGATGATLILDYGSAGVAPSTGDPEWSGHYTHFGYPITPDAGRFILEVTFQPTSGQTAPAWGTKA